MVVSPYSGRREMLDTFAMAEGAASARQAELTRKADDWLLGWFYKGDADEFLPAKEAFMAAWQERLVSNLFFSTREILADILKNGSDEAKQGLVFLSRGEGDAAVGDIDQLLSKEARHTVTSFRLQGQPMETKTRTQRLLLGDLVEIEEMDESRRAEELYSVFDRIEFAGGNEAKLEIYTALAALKHTDSTLGASAARLEDEFTGDPSLGRKLMRFTQGLSDPVNMSLMVAGFFTAHLTTAAAIGLIGRTTIGRIALALPLVPAATAVTIESGAFVLTERALRQGLTADEVDWGGGQMLKDWGSLATSFAALRLVGVPLALLGARAAKMGDAGKLAFGAGASAAQAGAFYAGGVASYAMGLRGENPEFLDEWLMLIQFQLGVRAANLATGNWAMRQASAMQALSPLDPKLQKKIDRLTTQLLLAPLLPFGVMATLTPEQMTRLAPDALKRYDELAAIMKRAKDVPELVDYVKKVQGEIDALEWQATEPERLIAETKARAEKAEAERQEQLRKQREEERLQKMTPEELAAEKMKGELAMLQKISASRYSVMSRLRSRKGDCFSVDSCLDKPSRARMLELVENPVAYGEKYGWAEDELQLDMEIHPWGGENAIMKEMQMLESIADRNRRFVPAQTENGSDYYVEDKETLRRLDYLMKDPESYSKIYGWAQSEVQLEARISSVNPPASGCSITLID